MTQRTENILTALSMTVALITLSVLFRDARPAPCVLIGSVMQMGGDCPTPSAHNVNAHNVHR